VVVKTAIRFSTFWWTLAFPIAVVAPIRAGAADAATNCLTIQRYDVRVTGHREAMPADNVVGTVSDWKVSFVAPVYVDRCPGVGMPMLINARSAATSASRHTPNTLHGGQFDRTFDWNDTTKLEYLGREVPPCHVTYTSNVPAMMWVTALFGATTASPAGRSFDFLAGEDFSDEAAIKADFEREADAKHAACDDKRHWGSERPISAWHAHLIHRPQRRFRSRSPLTGPGNPSAVPTQP
jgi:hypothetical protein